jgi:hypothetical protein
MPAPHDRLRSPEEQQARLPDYLPCPLCKRPTVLATAVGVLLIVRRDATLETWGRPSALMPGVRMFCNSAKCGWEGAWEDARGE